MNIALDTISSMKRFISGEPTMLPEDIRNLFSGYEELGGKTVKYEQTARFYKNHGNTLALATAGVVALDKPAPWLYSGRSNKQNKTVIAELEKIKSNMPEYGESESAIDYKKGRIQIIVDNSEHLQIEDDKVVINFDGSLTLKEEMAGILPHYSDSDINAFTPEDIRKMKMVRGFWKPVFRTVNVSKLKRVGLMYLQMHGRGNRIETGQKFIENKKGRPLSMKKFGKNEDTIRITKMLIADFKSDRKEWKKYRSVFTSELTNNHVVPTHTPSTVQAEFSESMNLHINLDALNIEKKDD